MSELSTGPQVTAVVPRWNHLTGAVAARGRHASAALRRSRSWARAAELAPVLADLRQGGASTLKALADGLNERGIPAARGGRWRPVQVLRLLARCDPAAMPGGRSDSANPTHDPQ